jgi:regulator of protease activity HflC (stomatin/prohibitin superfamily)
MTNMAGSLSDNESGSILGIFLFLCVISITLVVLVFFVFGKIVPPNKIGIRQNFFSVLGVLEEGYNERGLPPGLHWKIPGISDVILIPRDFQFVQLDANETTGDLNLPYLEIPTSDGSKVKTDITLVLRYFKKPGTTESLGVDWDSTESNLDTSDVPVVQRVQRTHGGPKDLVNTYGSSHTRQLKTFVGKSEDKLKRWLSALSTIDYYNPSLREKAALKSSESINEFANKEGIELWGTLVRRYTYSEQKIDDQIFAKNLQDATEVLNAAQSALAEARAKTEEMRAFWDGQKIAVLKEEGKAEVRVLNEEGKSYEAEQMARADKLFDVAISEIEKEKNQLLATAGGRVHVARKMVPVLQSLTGGVISDVDPYDIESWVRKLSGRARYNTSFGE